MSDPPPDEGTPSRYADNPTAHEIERLASTFETYTSDNNTNGAEIAKHNKKIRRWTRVATFVALIYTVVTGGVLIASIRSIKRRGALLITPALRLWPLPSKQTSLLIQSSANCAHISMCCQGVLHCSVEQKEDTGCNLVRLQKSSGKPRLLASP